jgi:hypothetical protein
MSDRTLRLLVETTPKKVFVSAVDWPGLSRGGRDEAAAVENLLAHLDRYAPIARAAGHPLPGVDFELDVAERVDGDAGTAFGMPSVVADLDRVPTDDGEAARMAALVGAAFDAFDRIAAAAPAELRKGPRGGGRDTARIVEHALGANDAYASVLGIPRERRSPPGALREALLEAVGAASDGSPVAGKTWPTRYAARRIAWHLLDHAWEIEDRAEPGPG